MATSQFITGMQGVYLVAAELSRQGFIVSLTSRGAAGADLLVTDQTCLKAFTVQIKTNKKTFGFWLIGTKARKFVSETHIYVLVNIKKEGQAIEYYVVPSKVISKNIDESDKNWINFYFTSDKQAQYYRDRWEFFGNPAD